MVPGESEQLPIKLNSRRLARQKSDWKNVIFSATSGNLTIQTTGFSITRTGYHFKIR